MKLLFRIPMFLSILIGSISVATALAQAATCIDYSQVSPAYLNTFPTDGSASELEIVGDLGYLTHYTGEFEVWDVSDPRNPVLLSTLQTSSRLVSIWVSGQYVYVAAWGSGVLVIDVSDPLAPAIVGSVDTPHATWNIIGEGDIVGVADGVGAATIDISDPGDPQLLGYVESVFSFCRDIAINGDVMYVAGWGGIEAYDISDPSNPIIMSRLMEVGQVSGMKVSGNLAYLSAWSSGDWEDSARFSIVDVTDPYMMETLGSVYTDGGGALDFDLRGHYAYVPNDADGLLVINIEDPTRPAIVGYGTGGHGDLGIALKEGTAIVCDQVTGLSTYDISGPIVSDALRIPGWTWGIEVHENLAYIGAGFRHDYTPWPRTGLQIVDVSDPENLQLVGSQSFANFMEILAVVDSYAYMSGSGNGNNGIHVVDVSDPSAPVEIGFQGAPSTIWDSAVEGDHLIVAAESAGVLFYDISDRGAPVLVATVTLPAPVSSVSVMGDRVYAGSWGHSLTVLDWRTPSDPVVAGSINLPDFRSLLAVHGFAAYISQGTSQPLLVLDVTDPGAISVIAEPDYTYDDIGYPIQMEIRGNVGYMADCHIGISILDLADPTNPVLIKKLSIPWVYGIRWNDDNFFILAWHQDMHLGTLYSLPLDCDAVSLVPDPPQPLRRMHLAQNHPNPFNPRTEISFSLVAQQRVTLKVFDLQGRLVRTLIDSEIRQGGPQSVTWNGRDRYGRTASAGGYLYRLETGRYVETRRMTLLK